MPPIRRVLTADDAEGRSFIAEDGASPAVRVVPERPGYRVTNLWRTAGGSAVDAPDSIAAHQGVSPPEGGTVLRIIDFPPEPADPKELERMLQATFGSMYRDAQHQPRPGEHPGMHRTRTVDYALMLEGELVAILDRQETVLRAGDVLIQRGTNHAWANRSGRPARIAFVLVDARAAA
ncbi:cupin domain-containing protein [Ramlibacter rhizophilus]|uniref:Cupin domain-containing protein n=2 Tax=Ramlibacter rhizophilus TaxID=1781167 RepID=A0A4Z0BFU5_9BURK|nr:cupin domain-containing protein [Ramlibacter rhizophilus]